MADPLIHSLACPNCHLADRVQRVSAIVKAGRWHGDLTGTTFGVDGDENVILHSESISELAKLLAPPEKPERSLPPWFIRLARHAAIVAIALVAGLALVQLVIEELSSIFQLPQPPQPRLLPWQIASVVMLYCLLLLGNAWLYRSKRTYDDALKKWKKAYYCHRCDGIFLQKPPKLVSPGDFAEWLYT
jgi:hypothetical protein